MQPPPLLSLRYAHALKCWSALVICSRVRIRHCVEHVCGHPWLSMEMYGSYISEDIALQCQCCPFFYDSTGRTIGPTRIMQGVRVCCYPACTSRKTVGVPAQIFARNRGFKVKGTGSEAWRDLITREPKIFNTKKGRAIKISFGCTRDARIHCGERVPLQVTFAVNMFHFTATFLSPNVSLLRRVYRAYTSRRAHADRCPSAPGVVTGHHEWIARAGPSCFRY